MATMSREESAHFCKLKDEITCSICLNELRDPVSITCGHSYCKRCISGYWSSTKSSEYRCPECRNVCPEGKIMPAYRLQQVVSNIQQAAQVNTGDGDAAVYNGAVSCVRGCIAPPRAIQLVYTDANNKICLDDSIVDSCLLDSEISDYPLCLICVIGEKRRGKSSLMNYVLRALDSLENGRPISLGDQDEPLEGFEWKSGVDSLTKGIWVWNKPFILENKGDKMAVFVLDTEGSLDIESDMETSLKLSALTMLLSSYLIFNVNANLKTTELEYLKMYLHVSELTGKSFSLQHLQHLNILVRDWESSEKCGKSAAESYIEHEMKKLQNSDQYRRVVETLRSPSTSGFLLPHPGKTFLKSNQGRLSDMDDDFRSHLTTYISDLVGSVWLHSKTDIQHKKITCSHLGRMLKNFILTLQRENVNFDSPMEMFYTFENYKNLDNIKKKFKKFCKEAAPPSWFPHKILKIKPSKMQEILSEKASCLLQEYELSLQGENDEKKKKLMDEMENLLRKTENEFCSKYAKRFKKCAAAVGGTVLTLTGGMAGPAVAGTVLATEVAIGVGGSVGASAGAGLWLFLEKME